MPRIGQANVVENCDQFLLRDVLADHLLDLIARRAVSSMRGPVGARKCSRIWPASTCGKKSRPRNEHESRATHAEGQEQYSRKARDDPERFQSSPIASAKFLERVLRTLLVTAEDAVFSARCCRPDVRRPRTAGTSPWWARASARAGTRPASRTPRLRPAERTGNVATPVRKNMGTNTMQMHSVETNAGTAICCAPSRMACIDFLAHAQGCA